MLSLRQLEVLRAVMRLRTTVGAAQEIGLSQPAISNAIRAIESTLGFSLFDRVGNRLIPTEQATDLHRACEPLFLTLQGVRQHAADLRSGRTGRLRLAVTAELADSILPHALSRFAARHPGVGIAVEICGMSDALDALEAGATQLVLGMALQERPGLALHELAALDMVCACPPGSTPAALDVVTPADLVEARLIAGPVGGQIHGLVASAFHAAGRPFTPDVEIRFMNAAARLVERGLGVAILDPLTAAAARGLVVRPFQPALTLRVSAASVAKRPLARLSRIFLVELRQAIEVLQRPAIASTKLSRSHDAHPTPPP